MGTASSAVSMGKPGALQAILWGGLTAGVLDICAAFTLWAIRGVKPVIILQGIASGLLGAESFKGGNATAALGAVLHFVIAFGATITFYAASRKLKFLTERFVLWGMVYGVAVHLFMTQVVLPLSAFRKGPFNLNLFVIQVFIHMFCVGLPIAFAVRRFADPAGGRG